MARRTLPDANEAAQILAARRSRPARRAPPTAGKSLATLLKPLEARFGQGSSALQARWPEIVGEVIARNTEPVKLTKPRGGGPGVLELRVNGPAATLIQHQAPQIIERVNLFLGIGTAGKLRIVQGPIRNSAARTTARPRRAPPLDAAQEASLARELSDAPDGPLKTSLLRLGREIMRRQIEDEQRRNNPKN